MHKLGKEVKTYHFLNCDIEIRKGKIFYMGYVYDLDGNLCWYTPFRTSKLGALSKAQSWIWNNIFKLVKERYDG